MGESHIEGLRIAAGLDFGADGRFFGKGEDFPKLMGPEMRVLREQFT